VVQDPCQSSFSQKFRLARTNPQRIYTSLPALHCICSCVQPFELRRILDRPSFTYTLIFSTDIELDRLHRHHVSASCFQGREGVQHRSSARIR
jgi:hypothetical protein